MKFSLNKKSFGLTEIIVSAVILASVMAGFLATFVGVKKYINRSSRRTIAANYIRSELSSLYNEVREDTWDTGKLQDGKHTSLPVTINAKGYSGSYTVTDCNTAGNCDNDGNYRRVEMKITLPSPD